MNLVQIKQKNFYEQILKQSFNVLRILFLFSFTFRAYKSQISSRKSSLFKLFSLNSFSKM